MQICGDVPLANSSKGKYLDICLRKTVREVRYTSNLLKTSILSWSLSSSNLAVDVVRSVEAKYPSLLFRHQLSTYVETMYGMIRDNFRRELSPILSSCIQGPGTP